MTSSPLRALALPLSLACVLAAGFGFTRAPAASPAAEAATPAELVATYGTLADAILAVKLTESNLVAAILQGGFAHAQHELQRAQAALAANDAAGAKSAVESLAALVAQLGSEGDNSVAAVRKRLLEGGHHHHSDGEAQGVYEPGFVIVTRDAKKALLDESKAIAQLAAAPDKAGLERTWGQVEATFHALMKAPR